MYLISQLFYVVELLKKPEIYRSDLSSAYQHVSQIP